MFTLRAAAAALICSVLFLSGCGFVTTSGTGACSEFFHPTSCTTTGTTATNYVFVANAGSNTVAGLGISTAGALSTLSGTPLTLTVVPTAVTVSRSNTFVWVGTVSQIFGYSISSTGTVAALNSGAALANANCADMQTTPDGKWLMVLDGTGVSVDLFAINSDGTLAASSGIGFAPSGSSVPRALRINPAGTVVAAALGTAGQMLFSFDTTTGAFTQLAQTLPPTLTSDNAITFDSTGSYLYDVRTGSSAGLVVEAVGATGALTPTTSIPYTTGSLPSSVVLDSTGTYVYVANRGDSTISGFSIGTGAALTALSGSPYASGSGVTQLGVDSTGTWLLAVAEGGTPDLTLYGFDTTTLGKLNVVSSASTGTTADVLALSH